jgi:hypothetical protein
MLGWYLEMGLQFRVYGFYERCDEVFLKYHCKFLSDFDASWDKEARTFTCRKV